jgi:hypothetical protein
MSSLLRVGREVNDRFDRWFYDLHKPGWEHENLGFSDSECLSIFKALTIVHRHLCTSESLILAVVTITRPCIVVSVFVFGFSDSFLTLSTVTIRSTPEFELDLDLECEPARELWLELGFLGARLHGSSASSVSSASSAHSPASSDAPPCSLYACESSTKLSIHLERLRGMADEY